MSEFNMILEYVPAPEELLEELDLAFRYLKRSGKNIEFVSEINIKYDSEDAYCVQVIYKESDA